jgi:SAM-dependent methyltransferase
MNELTSLRDDDLVLLTSAGVPRRLALRCLLALSAPALVGTVRAQAVPTPHLDVPYVPTPEPVVDGMIALAGVKAGDVLYDLGCGDGRVVIAGARKGATGVGIDINPERIAEAKENAKRAGVSDKVQFRVGDLFMADFSPATVVTLYLLPDVNRRLRPQLWKQLKVGTRIVSHDFDMGDEWPPEKRETVGNKRLFFWTITEKHKKAVA